MQIALIGSKGTLESGPFTQIILRVVPGDTRVETTVVVTGEEYRPSYQDRLRILIVDPRREGEVKQLRDWYALRRGREQGCPASRPTYLLFLCNLDYSQAYDNGDICAPLLLYIRQHLPEDLVRSMVYLLHSLIKACQYKGYGSAYNQHHLSGAFCEDYGITDYDCRIYRDRDRTGDIFAGIFSETETKLIRPVDQ